MELWSPEHLPLVGGESDGSHGGGGGGDSDGSHGSDSGNHDKIIDSETGIHAIKTLVIRDLDTLTKDHSVRSTSYSLARLPLSTHHTRDACICSYPGWPPLPKYSPSTMPRP